MAQLTVHRDGKEKPQIECPSCGDLVSPGKNPILDSYDCPECDTPIHSGDMKKYKRAMNAWESERAEDYLDV